jgi:hypothetical protein
MSTPTKPPAPTALHADRAILTALQSLPEYAPRNAQCTPASLLALEAEASKDELALREAERAVAEARTRMIASSWAFHQATLAAKVEVISQFGNDSHAVRAIGLTPRSERKRPVRRKAGEE